jgi:CubicO group peptidase (beta-lactamase class C family)
MKSLRLCLALLALSAAGAEDPFAGVPAAGQRYVENGEISGAVMLLADHEKILHLSAVGVSDLATHRAMQTDDLFWIASMTKPIAAVGLGVLVDDGKVGFDDPVEKYLPEFRGQWVVQEGTADRRVLVKSPRPITLRDLLTHTSGLGEYPATQPHWTLSEFTKVVAREPLRFQPGTRWAYSTAGIDTIGRVIEIVSGQSFAAFLQQRIFAPLGMKDTPFWLSPDQEKRFAHNYRPDATGKLAETPIAYLYGGTATDRARPALGGAGLFSTAADVATFYQAMLNHGEVAGRRILSAATLAEMTRKQTGDLKARAGMPWGLGFCVVEEPGAMEANAYFSPGTFGHGGAHGTQSWADPTRGLVYVFMIQRAGFRGNPDNSDPRRAYQDAIGAALNIPAASKISSPP